MPSQTCMCCGASVPDRTPEQDETVSAFCRAHANLLFLSSSNHDGTVNMTVRGEPGSILIYDDGSFDPAGLSGEQTDWPEWVPADWTGG